MKQRIILQEERDFGSKINATFMFIKQEFKPLLTSLAYTVLPFSLLTGVVYGLFNADLYGGMGLQLQEGISRTPTILDQYKAMFTGTGIVLMCLYIVSYLFLFSVVLSYMKLYHSGKTEISPSDVWNESVRHIPRLVVLYIVTAFIVIAATFLLFIPGIYVGVILSLSASILIFEDGSLQYTISESFSIARGKWWSTFGLLLVLGLLTGVMSLAFSLPITIYNSSLILAPENSNRILSSALGVIYATGTHLLNVIIVVGTAFQYFNLNERKYATKLIHDIDSIGQNTGE